MKVQFIFTFDGFPQTVEESKITIKKMATEKSLADFAKSKISPEMQGRLCKISCCVFSEKEIDLPEWFLRANGKMFFESGALKD